MTCYQNLIGKTSIMVHDAVRSKSGPGALCVGANALCRFSLALSVLGWGPGALCVGANALCRFSLALSVLGPALCVWGPGAFCVGPRGLVLGPGSLCRVPPTLLLFVLGPSPQLRAACSSAHYPAGLRAFNSRSVCHPSHPHRASPQNPSSDPRATHRSRIP